MHKEKNNESLKTLVRKGALWAFLETFSQRGVAFVVTMVLTRLLTPEDYGTLALLMIFVSIANSVASSGLGQALVQKKDSSEIDFNSVFYASLAMAIIVYAVLFFSAPFIASYFREPEITALLRVLSLSLVFSAINNVQNAELNRKMLFQLSFRISLIASFFSATVGITMALCGFGVRALVFSILAGDLSGMVARWFIIAWRPRCVFSLSAFLKLWSYGWKLTASSILNSLYKDLYGVFIGKLYTKADLAIVNRGRQVPALAMDSMDGTLARVAFPAFSRLQNDPLRLQLAMRRMIQCITFVLTPVMVGIALCAETIVLILFGEQWLPCVPYIRMSCFAYMIWPISSMNIQAINALGHSEVFLKLEIYKKTIAVVLVLAFVWKGVFVLMLSLMIGYELISLILNILPNRKYLGYTLQMVGGDVAPAVLLSMPMALVVASCFLIPVPTMVFRVVVLVIQVVLGCAVYLSLAYFFNIPALWEILKSVISMIRNRCHTNLQ